MNSLLRTIPPIWLTFLLLLSGIPEAAKSQQLIRFATLAPEGSTWMKTMHELDVELRRQTNNEVGFKFYPNMSMGDESDVIRKMRLGQINGGGFTGFGLGEILPEIRILELPFLFRNDAEIDTITSQLTGYFCEQLKTRGFIFLGWADVGSVYFIAQSPVAGLEDLKRQKIWMWQGDPLAQAFFSELKVSPVPLSVTDVHLSLQTGMINAVYCSPLSALVLQWFTRLKYVTDVPFTNAIGAVLIDSKTFERLSAQNQAILLDLSRSYLHELLVKSRSDNREAYQELLNQGLIRVLTNETQRKEMSDAGVRVQERLVDDLYSRELLERLRKMLGAYRSSSSLEGK